MLKMSWSKRIAKDIQELRTAGFKVHDEKGNEEITDMSTFLVEMPGPKDTPYEHGRWDVRFTITSAFPFASPSVGFVQHIMHPNVDFASGSICVDTLNSRWSPCTTVRHIVEVLLPYLLTYPNPDDPLNREAAYLMRNNATEYTRQVVAMVQLHSKK
jgi:ubiquitin-conjugating enzyme E2 H